MANPTFAVIEPRDQRRLLEESLNKLLIIDLWSRKELAFPYVKYIFECYFANQEERGRVHELIEFIESLQLSESELNIVKLLVLLQSDFNSSTDPSAVQQSPVATIYAQVQIQLYCELRRKVSDAASLTLLIGRILFLLSELKRLRKSHFHPIHCALLRWILLSSDHEINH